MNDSVRVVKSECPSSFVNVVPPDTADAFEWEWVELLSRLFDTAFFRLEVAVDVSVVAVLDPVLFFDFFLRTRAGKLSVV